MSSLLAHLYSRIKGSPEDVATMSLCYILENSLSARKVFSNYLSTVAGVEPFPDLFFSTQVVGEDKERPDLVGVDQNNNELLVCEAKFWAGLTVNQPLAYLKRLRENGNDDEKALVFICPHERIPNLWGELIRLCKNSDECSIKEEDGDRRVVVDGIPLGIVSWRAINQILMQALSAEHSPLVKDLYQLEGLCERMDQTAFKPFTPDDFGVDRAQRIRSYNYIVDRVADEMINKMNASTKGVKATPTKTGFVRYLGLPHYKLGISIQINHEYWLNYAETPFWFTLRNAGKGYWEYASETHETLRELEYSIPKRLFLDKTSGGILCIPLFAPPYAHEDEVVRSLMDSIKEVLDKLERK
jgi:hypothetical protein